MVPKQLPDLWERFINAGIQAGVPMTALMVLYRKYEDAPVKTIRASAQRKVGNRVG